MSRGVSGSQKDGIFTPEPQKITLERKITRDLFSYHVCWSETRKNLRLRVTNTFPGVLWLHLKFNSDFNGALELFGPYNLFWSSLSHLIKCNQVHPKSCNPLFPEKHQKPPPPPQFSHPCLGPFRIADPTNFGNIISYAVRIAKCYENFEPEGTYPGKCGI